MVLCFFIAGFCVLNVFAFFTVGHAPYVHGVDDGQQGAAKFSQGVFDFGWDDGVDFAVDQAIGFEFAQLQGQHALGDACEAAL